MPEKSGSEAPQTVRLAVRYPLDEFVASVEGAPVVTSAGTEVPVELESAIRAAAKQAGVQIVKG